MRILSFPRPNRLAAALLAAAIALFLWLALSPTASAQESSNIQGSRQAARQQPDACIQIYPPPAGCPGEQTPPPSPPSAYPGGAAVVPRVPSSPVVTNRPRYRPGEAISVIFRDGSGAVSDDSAYRCVDVELELLGSAGWSRVPGVDPTCPALAFAARYGGRAETLPANLQPGTYRFAFRLTTPSGGQQAIYSDPFAVG